MSYEVQGNRLVKVNANGDITDFGTPDDWVGIIGGYLKSKTGAIVGELADSGVTKVIGAVAFELPAGLSLIALWIMERMKSTTKLDNARVVATRSLSNGLYAVAIQCDDNLVFAYRGKEL